MYAQPKVSELRSPTGRRSVLLIAAAISITALVIVLENAGGSALNRLLLHLPGVDKVLHVAQSFVIGRVMFLVAGLLAVRPGVRLGMAASAAGALALFDEWQQQWFGRTIEVADVVASLAGVTIAMASTQIRRSPRIAVAAMVAGTALGLAVGVDSYRMTRDFNYGLLAEARGDFRAAYRHFLAARAAGVRTAELYNSLAWTGVESGLALPAEAVRDAEESLRLRPGDAGTLDTYGWALHAAGRSADAIVPLIEALRSNPGIYCIHYHLGAAYLATGDESSARSHLRQQIEGHPRSREALLAAALLEPLR